jgi:hypothetical protein
VTEWQSPPTAVDASGHARTVCRRPHMLRRWQPAPQLGFGMKRPVLADYAWTRTSYRLVIDTGHNEGTSLRENAGYDEKC